MPWSARTPGPEWKRRAKTEQRSTTAGRRRCRRRSWLKAQQQTRRCRSSRRRRCGLCNRAPSRRHSAPPQRRQGSPHPLMEPRVMKRPEAAQPMLGLMRRRWPHTCCSTRRSRSIRHNRRSHTTNPPMAAALLSKARASAGEPRQQRAGLWRRTYYSSHRLRPRRCTRGSTNMPERSSASHAGSGIRHRLCSGDRITDQVHCWSSLKALPTGCHRALRNVGTAPGDHVVCPARSVAPTLATSNSARSRSVGDVKSSFRASSVRSPKVG